MIGSAFGCDEQVENTDQTWLVEKEVRTVVLVSYIMYSRPEILPSALCTMLEVYQLNRQIVCV